MTTEEVLGKVSKLIVFSQNQKATEQEVVLTIQHAQKVFVEHNLTEYLKEEGVNNIEKMVEEVFGTSTQAKHPYVVVPVRLMTNLFFCETFLKQGPAGNARVMTIVGKTSSVEVAFMMGRYLLSAMNAIVKNEQEERLKTRPEREDRGNRSYIPKFRRDLAERLTNHFVDILQEYNPDTKDLYGQENSEVKGWMSRHHSVHTGTDQPKKIDPLPDFHLSGLSSAVSDVVAMNDQDNVSPDEVDDEQYATDTPLY